MGLFRLAAATVLLAAIAGCSSAAVPETEVDVRSAVSNLDGVWRVVGAGEPDGTVLDLTAADLALHRPCATYYGMWLGRGGLFLARLESGTSPAVIRPNCQDGLPEPQWVEAVVGYERIGDGVLLQEAGGETVVTLRSGGKVPDGAPAGRPEFVEGTAPRPAYQERARLNSTLPVALPTGIVPAQATDLLGRWVSAVDRNRCSGAFIDFRLDGTWVGSDGEDRLRGRWELGEDGLAVGIARDHITGSCAGPNAPDGWMFRVARIGFHGDVLAFFDPSGQPLARLQR